MSDLGDFDLFMALQRALLDYLGGLQDGDVGKFDWSEEGAYIEHKRGPVTITMEITIKGDGA